jgi:ATP-dependent DNA helicase RecQ
MFLPSLVQFTTDRETIEFTETRYPDHEPLIKCLLRTYGGIWDQPTGISEKHIAKMLRKPDTAVRSSLSFLSEHGILRYEPRKETPQVRFLQNRVKTDDLYINHDRYLARKQAFSKRLMAMAHYLEVTGTCRTRFICTYFGDDDVNECGICDHCVQKKKAGITKNEFDLIVSKIVAQLEKGPRYPHELISHLPETGQDPQSVIRFMIDEGRMVMNGEGKLGMA